jgi:O-acetyl-ADP-ribose deacetylase (regulator of RNase III)
VARTGSAFDHQVEAIVCAANQRGVTGVGMAGALRLGGGTEIEREIMSHAPLIPGHAYVTGAGALNQRGVRYVIHAVVLADLGAPARQEDVRRATTAALWELDKLGVQTVSMPPLGAGLGTGALTTTRVRLLMIEEIVAHLRRFHSRIERIVLLCQDDRDVAATRQGLLEARVLWPGLE